MKNHDHMLHCSWDMASDRCNYFSFWVIFCPFTSLTAQKIKMKKKQKKPLEISFYISVPKIMTICYTVPEIRHVTDVIYIFHFGLFFAVLHLEISSFYICYQNYDQMMYSSWDMVRDGWMDRWKKWFIEVGVPPKNI